MHENNDGLHLKRGPVVQRWRRGYARKLFGPEVADALSQAGYFRVPVDEVAEPR